MKSVPMWGDFSVELSHPSRGAWIEIWVRSSIEAGSAGVAPLAGCVD